MGVRKKENGSWREFGYYLKTVRLPWLWIAVAFICSMLYNEVMLHLPSTTAGLLSGSLDNQVLMDAICFYVFFTIVLWLFGVRPSIWASAMREKLCGRGCCISAWIIMTAMIRRS